MADKTLLLPRLGETMTEGTIISWQKQPGERFRRGESLLELETDKTAVDVPALEDGEMVAHLAAAGEVVPIDAPIATIRGVGDTDAASPAADAQEAAAEVPAPSSPVEEVQTPRASPPAVASPTPPSPSGAPPPSRPRSSPAARRLAQRLNIPLTDLRGTGPRGRVTTADVQQQQPRENGAASDRSSPAVTGVGAGESPRSRAAGTAFVEVASGERLHYRRWTGDPRLQRGTVLLLHGFAGDLTTWNATAESLTGKGFEVVAVDLPGHGATESRSTTPAACAEMLLGALDGLGISPDAPGGLHLVGHSLGGAVATYLAASPTVRFASLTLIAPVGLGTEINQAFLDGMTGAETAEALERELRKTTARPLPYSPLALAKLLETLRQEPRRRQLRALAEAFARGGVQQVHLVPTLRSLAVPVRVLFGRHDRVVRWQDALDLPGQVALHLFDTGHMPHWEDPRDLHAVIAQFPRLE